VTYSLPSGSLEKSDGEKPATGPLHGKPRRSVVCVAKPVHLCPTQCDDRLPTDPPFPAPGGCGGREESLAEQFDSSKEATDSETTAAPRGRARRLLARRSSAKSPALSTAEVVPSRRAARKTSRSGGAHPVRSFLTVTAVAGMVATVAIPAFAAARGVTDDAMTLQQVAAENAQSLVIASEATPEALERGGIVGLANLVACVRASESPYFFGPNGFVFDGAKPLPVRPCQGALGFFEAGYV